MGDVAWRDGGGRLWFCGRKSERVNSAGRTLYPVPVESVFNEHPAVRRSALVGAGSPQRPVICVELEHGVRASAALTRALLDRAAGDADAAAVTAVLYHRGFPVDIRHNAKIDRPQLARWATGRLR
jgi:acyl-coenzyme A synthetase/AMP-(fatty) acid ligase